MNVIQIVIDSVRADYLGCHGNDWVQTPNIDRLASESCLFDFALSESLPTVPVRRALSTCKRTFPYRDGPRPKGIFNSRYGWRPLPDEHVTTAERLVPTDYTTGIVVDTYHLMKPAMNFHRFFDSWQWIRGQENDLYRSGKFDREQLRPYTNYDDLNAPQLRTLTQFMRNQQGRDEEHEYQEAQLFGSAAQWVEDNADEQFFLWVDSFSPHPPWRVPQRLIEMYDPGYKGLEFIFPGSVKHGELTDREIEHMRCIYAANLTWVDECLGKLLDKIDECGLRENTLVVLLSDHGQMLGEYDRKIGMASEFVFPELYRLMAMMRHPEGTGAGKRVASPVYNIDLIATMLELIGLDVADEIDGTSLWPLITGEQDAVHDYLISAQQDYQSVWDAEWLYVRGPEAEHLYRPADDPAQHGDLAQTEGAKCREMGGRLDAYLTQCD